MTTPEFKPVSDFPRGTLYALLADAYSFDPRCARHWSDGPIRIIVTTSAIQLPAQKMDRRAGFREIRRCPDAGFAGELTDYEYSSEQL